MTNNLSALLAELSEIAPQICRFRQYSDVAVYHIDDYGFFINLDGEFTGQVTQDGIWVTGNPAYDWLQGALMRVIKSKDWGYKIQSPANTELAFAKVYFLPDGIFSSDGDNPTEALLTALIQAIKGEQ